jgi:hypothetical protein
MKGTPNLGESEVAQKQKVVRSTLSYTPTHTHGFREIKRHIDS